MQEKAKSGPSGPPPIEHKYCANMCLRSYKSLLRPENSPQIRIFPSFRPPHTLRAHPAGLTSGTGGWDGHGGAVPLQSWAGGGAPCSYSYSYSYSYSCSYSYSYSSPPRRRHSGFGAFSLRSQGYFGEVGSATSRGAVPRAGTACRAPTRGRAAYHIFYPFFTECVSGRDPYVRTVRKIAKKRPHSSRKRPQITPLQRQLFCPLLPP